MVHADPKILAREARAQRLASIQAEIDAGRYETADKLNEALDRLMARERLVPTAASSADASPVARKRD